MEQVIRNQWRRDAGGAFEQAAILRRDVHPEGLDVGRVRFVAAGRLTASPDEAHLVSTLRGRGTLFIGSDGPLRLEPGVHVYLPPGQPSTLELEAGSELVRVSAPASQARGRRLLVRDETFVAACASASHSLRWVLTPQYLSRRVFLHHDQALLSRSGHPVSWFHTTMFDVTGLPTNEDGEPVFKMSYNSRTEFNVCYDVAGTARVRMAQHPYLERRQAWGPWQPIDGDATYHLNEAVDAPAVEWRVDDRGTRRPFRNKHEVYIERGHVSLFCLFDPAPTGVERHRPGEYSDYEPIEDVLATPEYTVHKREIARYDEMLDGLSLAKARGELASAEGGALWQCYLEGRRTQQAIEAQLSHRLAADGSGRERAIARWRQPDEA